ncbi:MAG: ubiquitin-like domain-containing protein [Propionibacteriaceae bacterium]|nr:ubiquitin-like domain-containing protein [Propionibacteriaceae bacterium]
MDESPTPAAEQEGEHMRKVLVGAVVGFATIVTISGLGVASWLTADLTLTVDGNTSSLRALSGQTVGQVLDGRGVTFEAQDFVSPSPDTTVTNGLDIQVAHARPFTATIDGDTKTVTTTAATIGSALVSMGIDMSAADLSLPPQTEINPATTVTVTTSKMVSLRADGSTLFTQTSADNVAELLTERGLVVGSIDRVTPSPSTPLTDDMNIVVQRVQTIKATATIELDYPTNQVKTSTLTKGQTNVTTPGVKGSADQVWEVTMVDGVEESRALVSQTTTKEPVTEVVEVGTRTIAKSVPVPNVTPGSAQDIARQMLPEFGFGDDQFGCLVNLWNHESGWRVNAQNKSSGAYGIPQSLPGSKMASAGADWRTNPATQIRWGLGYIKGRYGTPCGAWGHFQSIGWY